MPAIAWIDPDMPADSFPPVQRALRSPPGLLAAGGDLSPPRLLAAYRRGIFPWYSEGEPILWWSPDPRAVIFPDQVHIARRLARRMRQQPFTIRMDQDFGGVLSACAAPRGEQAGTWLVPEMRRAYLHMHELGYAHSVETREGDTLVGGVYGLALGGVFFGESMFSHRTDASKIALVHLCRRLHESGFILFDCQVASPHLERMGANSIAREQFLQHLRRGLAISPASNTWQIHEAPAWPDNSD
jgi:leucyl/phenylalanyl-tRNA---protein transferase